MNYITAEQFLSQSKKVQKSFIEWWQPSVGDIYCNLYNNGKDNVLVINKCQLEIFKSFKSDIKMYGVPFLHMHQLINFIEDKTKCKLIFEYTCIGNIVIKLAKENLVNGSIECKCKFVFDELKFDLIGALWEVACNIAEKED